MPGETQAVVRAVSGARKTLVNGFVVRQGSCAGHEVVIAEAGMGFQNATAAAARLIHEFSLDMMVSAGFCGGVSPNLQVGDVVVATGLTVVSEKGLDDVPVELTVFGRDFVASQAAEGRRVFGGVFASTPGIMPKKQLASLLPAAAPYPVVEMESAVIALVAVENGIPFSAIRAVSDPFDEELAFSLDEFCDDRMRIRIPRVLLTVARKPRIIPQLIRLAGNSRVAAASLSQAIKRFLAVM
jgi:adenosylhomocysteine nucleosidase